MSQSKGHTGRGSIVELVVAPAEDAQRQPELQRARRAGELRAEDTGVLPSLPVGEERERPDVLCLQEIKASLDQLPVWLCDRDPGHVEVIGSYARLAEPRGLSAGCGVGEGDAR